MILTNSIVTIIIIIIIKISVISLMLNDKSLIRQYLGLVKSLTCVCVWADSTVSEVFFLSESLEVLFDDLLLFFFGYTLASVSGLDSFRFMIFNAGADAATSLLDATRTSFNCDELRVYAVRRIINVVGDSEMWTNPNTSSTTEKNHLNCIWIALKMRSFVRK